jgi:hypothetical protein
MLGKSLGRMSHPLGGQLFENQFHIAINQLAAAQYFFLI